MSDQTQGSFKINFDQILFEEAYYFVPAYAKHRPACVAILNGQYYEPNTHILIKRLMEARPGNMVHAGTFYGDMLPSFSRKCPKIIYAFEPVLENYILAKLAVMKNKLKNVALFNSGLGDQIGITCIATHATNGQHMGGASKISHSGQTATITTIDSFGLNDLSIIQLDVEGHELLALKGAKSTIERNQPVILIEDNNNNCSGFLEELNYALVGKVPGLSIWASFQDVDSLTQIIEGINV